MYCTVTKNHKDTITNNIMTPLLDDNDQLAPDALSADNTTNQKCRILEIYNNAKFMGEDIERKNRVRTFVR